MLDKLADATENVFNSMNISFSVMTTSKSMYHTIESDTAILVGITGQKNSGMITFEFDDQAKFEIIDTMMQGMEVEADSDVARSAIAELSNMISGMFLSNLDIGGLEITTPTIIQGENLLALINTLETQRIYANVGAGGNLIISLSFG
ncbi:chemotaxis protein CheX [Marinitoga sp. 1138]|uniref:chemotaxis protein CheX n=1 Tax=Marinitoga sp. 1138 TaxID=1643334 RepID=UPI001585FF7C|nr:chemotaxis protein CheX [Marinitoga sp. 1138]NUU96913.1 hypothetical protein [Marinitoga sp. 1138]